MTSISNDRASEGAATSRVAVHGTASNQDVTTQLVAQTLAHKYVALPADVIELARLCILDYTAVGLAGAHDPAVSILIDHALGEGAGRCSLFGSDMRVTPSHAALINGTAAHALDFDDCHLTQPGHVSVAILPALIALAETRGASGADFISAFVAGFEVACRIGLLVAPDHYNRGFHATATAGSFAAAAACAHLLQLSPTQTACALGIAGAQTAGLKSMFGTMCKPLQAGKAAQNGLLAALLSERGFESRLDVLECRQGFAATQSRDFNPEAALANPVSGFHIRDNLFKFHAACFGTHGAIEAARALRDNHGFAANEVCRVVAKVAPINDTMCNIPAPCSVAEAKFSLRLMIAYALDGIDTGILNAYGESTINEPRLVTLRDKVEIILDPKLTMTQADLAVELKNGNTLSGRYDAGVPERDLRRLRQRLETKFRGLVGPILGEAAATRLARTIDRTDTLDSAAELQAAWAER
jgi:2-methylcitrate dehydratase PrpD